MLDDSGNADGLIGPAAPVRSPHGRIAGGLPVNAPAARLVLDGARAASPCYRGPGVVIGVGLGDTMST